MGVGQIMCVSFPFFGIEGGMWGVIILIPDHCLSIYFTLPKQILTFCSNCFRRENLIIRKNTLISSS